MSTVPVTSDLEQYNLTSRESDTIEIDYYKSALYVIHCSHTYMCTHTHTHQLSVPTIGPAPPARRTMPTVAGAMMSLILVWVCVSREGSLGPGMGPSAQRSSGTLIPALVSVGVWLHRTCDFTEGSCDFA